MTGTHAVPCTPPGGYTSNSREEVGPMVTRVQKWGNSQGLRLSKELLSAADIDVGDAVDVTVRDGSIVVTPARRVRGALELDELLAAIPDDYRHEELDWGPAVGNEVW